MTNDKAPKTMKDIANELGISVSTVSRALQDSPRISKERREMIQAYARKQDFTPDIIAKSLRNSRTAPMKVIGVIIPQFIHYYFDSILSGIENYASQRGYRIMVAQSSENYDKEVNICHSFEENRVCGIIVSQAKDTRNYDHFSRLIDKGLPLVFYDRICTGINASHVVVDDYDASMTAVNYLIERGCRRIAYYGSTLNLEISKNRLNGYRDALLKHGIRPDEELIRVCDDRNQAEFITPEVLSLPQRPDAFFAINDDTALGILYSAKRMGLRIPDDISICGFTDGIRARSCDPQLTTVEQRGVEVGTQAAQILIGQVEGTIPRDKVVKRVVRTRLIIRGTTK